MCRRVEIRRAADLGCEANGTRNPRPKQLGSLPLTAEESPNQGCNYRGMERASVSRAQQNFVVPIRTANGKTVYVWTGEPPPL